MSGVEERRLRPLSNGSRAQHARDIRRLHHRDARARFRFQCIQFVCAYQGGLVKAHRALVAAIQSRVIKGFPLRGVLPIPCVDTVARWRRDWREKKITPVATAPRYVRNGNPRRPMPKALRTFVEQDLLSGTGPIATLHEHAVEHAKAHQLLVPSLYRVREFVRQCGHMVRVVARHGQRAGLMDASVHAAVPAAYPHHVWYVDELQWPVAVRAHSPITDKLEALLPTVITITDARSAAIVNAYLVDPLRRPLDEQRLEGFTATDVRAAFAGAFFKDLALPACRHYAGHVPKIVRLDNHKAHVKLAESLREFGIEVPFLPFQEPRRRGQVESTINLVKKASEGVRGYIGRYRVAEDANMTQTDILRLASGTTGRVRAKSNILIEQLLTMDEAQEALDALVCRLNERRTHTSFRHTRRAEYDRTLRIEEFPRGLPMIQWLQGTISSVRRSGVKYATEDFTGTTRQVALQYGERVEVRLDPALRGIFVPTQDGAWAFLGRVKDHAAKQDAGKVATAAHTEVALIANAVRAAKAQKQEAQLGAEGAARANDVARQQLNQKPERQKQHHSKRNKNGTKGTKRRTTAARKTSPTRRKNPPSITAKPQRRRGRENGPTPPPSPQQVASPVVPPERRLPAPPTVTANRPRRPRHHIPGGTP